jgi:hypothetical protein
MTGSRWHQRHVSTPVRASADCPLRQEALAGPHGGADIRR